MTEMSKQLGYNLHVSSVFVEEVGGNSNSDWKWDWEYYSNITRSGRGPINGLSLSQIMLHNVSFQEFQR